jgi:hypothetical protein
LNDSLLHQFRTVCDKVADYPGMSRAAAAGGWQPIEDAANAQLARINRTAREAIGSDGRYQTASFSRQAADQRWFLVVSRWEGEAGVWGNGCRIYDFAADRPIDRGPLEQWVGRPPTGNQSFGAVGSNLLWEPGWRNGMTVAVNHVPATSPFAARYGLTGNILVAQALGGR